MKERQRHTLTSPVYLCPNDTLTVRILEDGKVIHKFNETCKRTIRVDTVVTFDIDEPILGLVDGIGAIFGDSGKQ